MGGNTARFSAERKPHEYQSISSAAHGMRVSCLSCRLPRATETLTQPHLGSWSQGRLGLSLPAPGFGYFRVFLPPGPVPASRTRLHPCSHIERLGLWRLQGFVSLVEKFVYLSGLHPYFCWSFFSFHAKCHPSDAQGMDSPPEMQHPSFCSVLSGFFRC